MKLTTTQIWLVSLNHLNGTYTAAQQNDSEENQ